MSDSIAFYSNEELKGWLEQFNQPPSDVLIIANIPFSYYEIRDEILRRDRCQGALEI